MKTGTFLLLCVAIFMAMQPLSGAQGYTVYINDLSRVIIDFREELQHRDFRISRDFEKMEFSLGPKGAREFSKYVFENTPGLSRDTTPPAFINPYVMDESQHPLITTDSSKVLSVFYEMRGFEQISNIFVTWKRRGDSLDFKCISDTVIPTAIGFARLNEIHPLRDSGYIVIGSNSGGDDGDGWQSVWFDTWDGRCHLDGIYEARSRTESCQYREYLKYEFDPHTFVATLTKRHDRVIDCEDDNQPIYDDSVIVTTERVDFLKLLR